jgi:HEAT repeat protein
MRLHTLFLGAALSAFFAVSSHARAGVPLESLSDAWAQTALHEAQLLQAANPTLAESIRSAYPRESRSGAPVFADPSWATPEAAGAIIALVRTGGNWAPAVAGMMRHEADPAVRRMMVETMQRAPLSVAKDAVGIGLQDDSPAVREAALRAIGSHKQGVELAPQALQSLSDASPSVREEAARSLGYAGYTAAFDPVRNLLTDADASVRFRALRTLEKLDLSRTRQLTELANLATDNDVKVAREAQKLLAQ